MHYIEAGSGPPLLLLHGLFDRVETWDRLLPLLSPHFKLYAVDLPGFGKTPLPEKWDESLSGMVDAVTHFMDEKDIDRVSLLGNSMGGSLALALAEWCPSRVYKIALLNPYGLPNVPLAMKNAQRVIFRRVMPYLLRKSVLRQCAKSIFSRSLYNAQYVTPELIEQVIQPFLTIRARKNLFRFLASISFEKIREIDAGLPSIGNPVLIIWGKEDRWLSPSHCNRLLSKISESKKIELPRCGHQPQREKPEVVAEYVRMFLSEN